MRKNSLGLVGGATCNFTTVCNNSASNNAHSCNIKDE